MQRRSGRRSDRPLPRPLPAWLKARAGSQQKRCFLISAGPAQSRIAVRKVVEAGDDEQVFVCLLHQPGQCRLVARLLSSVLAGNRPLCTCRDYAQVALVVAVDRYLPVRLASHCLNGVRAPCSRKNVW